MRELFDSKANEEGLLVRSNFSAFTKEFAEIGRNNGLDPGEMTEEEIEKFWAVFNGIDLEVTDGVNYDDFEHALGMLAI